MDGVSRRLHRNRLLVAVGEIHLVRKMRGLQDALSGTGEPDPKYLPR